MTRSFVRLFAIFLIASLLALPGMTSLAQEQTLWSLPELEPSLSPDGLTGYNLQIPLVMIVDENPAMKDLRISGPSADEVLAAQQENAVTGMTFTFNYIAAGGTDPWGQACQTFPESAKTAFQAAAVILSNRMQSTVPIAINACWANLGSPTILGYSGGGPLHRDFSGAPKANVWYAGSLANSLAGSDLSASYDMNITYNSGFSWYYGTDGNTTPGQYDLVTVAAHEIAHGLNFSGSASYSSGSGSYGYGTGYPNVYDTFVEDVASTKLTSYTNPSVALGTLLTSGSLWFNGTSANANNGGGRVKIYAPGTWAGGSSYSHLDYSTFAGTKNSMMVYAIASGASNHYPGNVAIGLFQDIGWKTPVDPNLVWTYCAAENATCSFSGMRYVRFGANGSYFYSKYTNSVSCTTGVFGDPIPGTPKTCYYSSDPSPAISVNPASWDFGSLAVGSTSTAKSFTVTNTGTANLVIGALSITGNFALSSNTCNSATVAPAGTCTFGVTFSPASAGAKAGSVSIPSNAPTTPTSVALSGTGIAPTISINPTSWDFGSLAVASTSTAKSFTVTNTGSANLVIGTLSITGNFALSSSTCNSATVAPAGTCTFGVTFSPTSTGAKAGSISIPSNAPTSPTSVALSGTGIAPVISVNPTSWDFGSQAVGSTSTAKSFTVTNTGSANLVIGTLSITGNFALSSNTCNSATVAPAGTCTFGVTFSPASAGAKVGSVSIPSNASTSPNSVSLSGTGTTAPALSVNPVSWDFGSLAVGSTSTAKSFTVTNTGTANLVIGALSITGNFALSSNTCNSATVAPAGTCTFGVTFSPTSTGAKVGSVSIPSNAPTTPTSVALSGTGIAPVISVNPTSWDFGSQAVGSTSTAKSFTVTNTGSANLVIGTLSITGNFALSSSTCNSATVAPAGTCTFGVTFSPTSTGAKVGSVTIPSNTPTTPTSVALSGTGIAPALSVTPVSWDFGSQAVGSTSTAKSFTVTNTGTANLVIGVLSITGNFALSSNTCTSATVAPAGTCTFGVTFSPASTGAKVGSISIPSNASSSPDSASLSGTGIAPAVSLNPTSWDFGSQNVGSTSTAKSFTVTNTGTANLVIGPLSITGNFALSSNTCTSATVAPAGTCTFGVTFSPASTGAKVGSVSIPSNASSSPDSVSLSGYGTPSDATPPFVLSSIRVNPSPTNLPSVEFTVTFSEAVTGVDANDFGLTPGNSVSGASITSVTPVTSSAYTVKVSTGTGNGTIRLNVVDNNSIVDAAFNPLGGAGVGDGDFTTGEIYTVIKYATFIDVPLDYSVSSYIERLYNAGITGGCSTTPLMYCPENTVTRAQMAVFLLRGIHGSNYIPPAVGASTGFADVPTNHPVAAWIKQLAAEGITGGCGNSNYCPDAAVTRAQMAVFLLRSKYTSAYIPPSATGDFTDVPTDHLMAAWIEQLAAEGITGGCGAGIYCPDGNVTRAQMAVFLVRTFNLP